MPDVLRRPETVPEKPWQAFTDRNLDVQPGEIAVRTAPWDDREGKPQGYVDVLLRGDAFLQKPVALEAKGHEDPGADKPLRIPAYHEPPWRVCGEIPDLRNDAVRRCQPPHHIDQLHHDGGIGRNAFPMTLDGSDTAAAISVKLYWKYWMRGWFPLRSGGPVS
jgi:hypothetical protein